MKNKSAIIPFSKININSFFLYEVEDIEKAYRIGTQIRSQAKNISAGGQEVEQAIRDFLIKRLPQKYNVTNGHIIDKKALVSPQYDILITDSIINPVLYSTKDDTTFVLFESVYTIGEVKSTWYSKDLFSEFCKNIKRTETELNRKKTDNRDIGNGILLEPPTSLLPYKNPVFYFMFFVESRKFDTKDIQFYFSEEKEVNKYTPNIICLLDKGVVVNIDKELYDNENTIKINLYPHLQYNTTNEWVLIHFEDDKASVLAYFYTILLAHLNNTQLTPPNLLDYSNHLFNINSHKIITLK